MAVIDSTTTAESPSPKVIEIGDDAFLENAVDTNDSTLDFSPKATAAAMVTTTVKTSTNIAKTSRSSPLITTDMQTEEPITSPLFFGNDGDNDEEVKIQNMRA
ncbi:unnamed protein product [Onchocerca flexuosa]|uniref:Uncharacterized protein n=1 Tax=Onchocerca flexuosa TaxID=387005 RepID=A0A183HLY9_9BILA|nr:unnamed protein product [Onchocerca flexuosa]